MGKTENLSDSRGNAFGIRFFLLMLKILGINRTCEFVWVIALFYTCFDRKAREAAKPYLSHRFPGAGRFAMFRHTWALFTSQGQALVESAAMIRKGLQWDFIDEELSERLMDQEKGFLLLTSHFGAWNAIMGGLHVARKPVNILVTPDRNANVDKTLALTGLKNPVRIISTKSAMGGLIEVFDAIERGEIVCMMGDRCLEGEGIEVEFLGGRARFPSAAFYLAARCGCAVLPLFAVRTHRHTRFAALYGPEMRPVLKGRKRGALQPYLEIYVRKLEELSRKYPYQCFLFEDIWSPVGEQDPTDSEPHPL